MVILVAPSAFGIQKRLNGVSSVASSKFEMSKSSSVLMEFEVDCKRATMFAVYDVYMNTIAKQKTI